MSRCWCRRNQASFPLRQSYSLFIWGSKGLQNLTEEARDPSRDLPRAIFYSIGITTFLYVLVSLAVIVLATPGELASSEAPLALAIQKAWPRATNVLSAIAIFATANTVLISLIGSSRLAFSMGRDGKSPRFFLPFYPFETHRGLRRL